MNRLSTETSPYLRQHSGNPVDWYPWGADAFAAAVREDKPLFVSIGYSSCHWCHVMAHESFEDPAIAEDLRRSFIAVKVDREERPDVDAVYMAAVQAMSGSGGWPMSVFCTPDGRPFFGGTYYPPTDSRGMPGFPRVLDALATAWAERREEVERQADALAAAVAREVRLADALEAAPAVGEPAAERGARPGVDDLLDAFVGTLAETFDPEWGGFGAAPKFPRPSFVELLLFHHRRTGEPSSLEMATRTLDAMAAGGLFDHLVGGFARYSTDRTWLVPHFEKMLTDQALLARAYLHAWTVTGRDDYRQVMAETIDYILQGLGDPVGGLRSSEDADAQDVEGGHVTFTASEVRDALGAEGRSDLADEALAWYGITDEGNWEGTNVPHRPLGGPLARPPRIQEARRILAEARRTRPRPGVDDKVLTEWNAMAASAIAEAAAATGNPHWAARAEAIGNFLFDNMRRDDGRWLRSWQGGRAHHLAFAADYAWVVDCCTRLGELTGRAQWTQRASETADALLGAFSGDDHGGALFTTGVDAEQLVVRPKDVVDGALPAANSVAALALSRLAALTGELRHRTAAEQIVATLFPLLAQHPTAVPDLLAAAAVLEQISEVVVSGERPDLLAVVRARWLPTSVLAWGERTASPLWAGRRDGFAYLCRDFTCQTPAQDPATLADQLEGVERDGRRDRAS